MIDQLNAYIEELCQRAGLTQEEVEKCASGKSFEEFESSLNILLKDKNEASLTDPHELGDYRYRRALTNWCKCNETLLKEHKGNIVLVNLDKGLVGSVPLFPVEKFFTEDNINVIEKLILLEKISTTVKFCAKFVVNLVNEKLTYTLLAYPHCIASLDTKLNSSFSFTEDPEIVTEIGTKLVESIGAIPSMISDS